MWKEAEAKKERKKVLMGYLGGHILFAWLLTGCYTTCFFLQRHCQVSRRDSWHT